MRRFIVLASALVLVACGSVVPPTDGQPVVTHGAAPESGSGDILHPVIEYAPIGNRVPGSVQSVLFFAKAGDPFSEENDRLLRVIYGSGAAALPTYRIERGAATGAELKYRVIVEDTFVLVGTGSERLLSIVHPSELELRTLLSGTGAVR